MSLAESQGRAVAAGFRYWRGDDAHGIIGSTEQAVRLLRELVGVEVQIDDVRDHGCAECGPMHETVGQMYQEAQAANAELLRLASDRDILASDLAQVREELARVRRNHLRRMGQWSRRMWGYHLNGDPCTPVTLVQKRRAQKANRFYDLSERCRAALATQQET